MSQPAAVAPKNEDWGDENQAFLSWAAPCGAKQYNIYRSEEAFGPIDYSSPHAVCSGTSWTSVPLGPGKWWFAIAAVNEDGVQGEPAVTTVLIPR